MRLIPLALLTSTLPLATTLPTTTLDLTQFYLVTTNQSSPSANSSLLRGVSATTPFAEDPITQSTLLLRLLGPGYNTLPNFTLTSGTLSTTTSGPHGIGTLTYNSSIVKPGAQLTFYPSVQPAGNIGLQDGYLVTVDGESKGWTVCKGQLGQEVVVWQGRNESCWGTWVQAVGGKPYKL